MHPSAIGATGDMARFLNHSFAGRKAVLFCLEQSLVLATTLTGAAAAAVVVGGTAFADGAVSANSEVLHRSMSWAFRFAAALASRFRDAAPWAFATTAACAASFYAADLYDLRRAAADRSRGGRRILGSLAFVAALVAIRAVPASVEERALALGAILAAATAVVALRGLLPAIVGAPIRILIAGAGPSAVELGQSLLADAEDRVDLVGFVPLEGQERAVPRGLIVSAADGLAAAATSVRAHWIVVATEEDRGAFSSRDLVAARVAGFVCMNPAMAYERLLRRIPVANLRPSHLAYGDGFRLSTSRAWVKRAFDVVAAAIGIVLAAPILAAAALAIRLDSRGPIFYRQQRVGAGGRPFDVIKLRTMRPDAEASGTPRWAAERDPRITRVGAFLRRTRMDEIPQLFNVLRGDMSMVGPRPERPFFVQRLVEQVPWYGLREAVRPGVTGWAQLRYPYGASVEDARRKLEYDLYYVKNGSLFLDLAIVFHTVRHVLMARGSR